MAQAPVSIPPRHAQPGDPVRLDRLADSVRRLDPATRALLDLSVRRGVRDDVMAPILHTDPFHLAWRRARALERVASEVGGGDRPAPLGEVRMALEALPREAWGLPGIGPPALPAGPLADAEQEVAPNSAADSASPAPPPVSDVGAEPSADPPTTDATATGKSLVPVAPAGRLARLDAFAAESPPLFLALRQLGRALAAKAVRAVVWPRRRP
jgi:hypothetical protein